MSDETESPRTAPVTRYRAGANSTSNTRRRWPMDSSPARLNPQSVGYRFGVLDPSAWRSGHHWRLFVRRRIEWPWL